MDVARRYAAATLATVPSGTEAMQAFAASTDALAQALATLPALTRALNNPRLSVAERKQLATTCAKATEAPAALKNLLQVLAAHRRLPLLPQVVQQLQAQMAARSGIVPLVVHTAVPLTDMQKIQLKLMVKQYAKAKDVALQEVLKPALLGGFRAFFSGLVWENSVSGHLSRLKAQLKHAVE
jgi:F-type H+-transporting ATPase subunit delta